MERSECLISDWPKHRSAKIPMNGEYAKPQKVKPNKLTESVNDIIKIRNEIRDVYVTELKQYHKIDLLHDFVIYV